MWHASMWSGLHIILTQILCNCSLWIWNADEEEEGEFIFFPCAFYFNASNCPLQYFSPAVSNICLLLQLHFSGYYQIFQPSFINTFINIDTFMTTHRHS